MKSNQVTYSSLIISFLVCFVSYYSIYFLPKNLTLMIFFIFLLFQVFSKNQKIWIALLIFISLEPSRMFSSHLSSGGINRVPIFDFIGSYGFTYLELNILILLIKTISSSYRYKSIFNIQF